MVPQYCWVPPASLQVSPTQLAPLAQTLAMPPPPHSSPAGQAQLRGLLQPSPIMPQYWYWAPAGAQLVGMHMGGTGAPQTPGMPPPPQVSPALVQAPQSMRPPQLSPTIPQYWPVACTHWVFMQPTGGGVPQMPGVPPPPQVAAPMQPPQSFILPQP